MPTSMARRTSIHALLAPRVAALADVIAPALGGDPTAVHQARVASRRLREVLPVLVADGLGQTSGIGRKVRRVTRALGSVRELDVAAGHFDEAVTAHPVSAAAQNATRQWLKRERATALRKARATLTPARRARMSSQLAALGDGAARVTTDETVRALQARVVRRARDVERAVDRVSGVYVPGRLHAVRIAVKRLRYALETSGAAQGSRVSTQLRQLRVIQDLLGRAHDLHVLAGNLADVQLRIVARSRAAARDLGGLAGALDQECRQLHAAFMSRRDALLALSASLLASTATSGVRSAA